MDRPIDASNVASETNNLDISDNESEIIVLSLVSSVIIDLDTLVGLLNILYHAFCDIDSSGE